MQAIMRAEQELLSTRFTSTPGLVTSSRTISRLPIPAARIRAEKPYLFCAFT